jgi:hypothetical protein
MSFLPLTGSTVNSATIGVGAQPKILEEKLIERDRLYERRLHEPEERDNNKHLIVIIIISAIIFVTVIAVYDVIKGALNNYFSNLALIDPNSKNTEEDINRTNIADYYALMATIIFTIVAIIFAIIAIPLLLYMIT